MLLLLCIMRLENFILSTSSPLSTSTPNFSNLERIYSRSSLITHQSYIRALSSDLQQGRATALLEKYNWFEIRKLYSYLTSYSYLNLKVPNNQNKSAACLPNSVVRCHALRLLSPSLFQAETITSYSLLY